MKYEFFKLLPLIFIAMLLGAHFYLAGLGSLVVFALLFPGLLFIRRVWVVRLVQIILVLGALEWVRTLLILVAERRADGQPWERLAIIKVLIADLQWGQIFILTNGSFNNHVMSR